MIHSFGNTVCHAEDSSGAIGCSVDTVRVDTIGGVAVQRGGVLVAVDLGLVINSIT